MDHLSERYYVALLSAAGFTAPLINVRRASR